MRKKPKVAFLPISMKLFWILYPDLEERFVTQRDIVKKHLNDYCDVLDLPSTGDEEDAEVTVQALKKEDFDAIIVWENGYVASAIPFKILKEFKEYPCILMITQRDKEIPLDMTYARYMESTATTSAMELGGVMARMKMPYRTIVGHMDEEAVYQKAYQIASAAMAVRAFRNAKIGSIGYPYPGMLDICVDDADVTALGPKIQKITLVEIQAAIDQVTDRQIEEFEALTRSKFDISRIKKDDFIRAAKTYLALEKLIGEYHISALCVHDYDYLSTVTGAVSDFALSMLENQYGLATGVEGDMPNCLSAFIARLLTGQSSMFVDWTMFDEKLNAIFLQHNGKADPDIVDHPTLSPSAEPFGGVIGDGVVVEASGKASDVTLISMIYRDGWKITATDGKCLEQPVRPCQLNQMTVSLSVPIKEFIEKACDQGIGHHLNVAQGHIKRQVQIAAQLLNIEFIQI